MFRYGRNSESTCLAVDYFLLGTLWLDWPNRKSKFGVVDSTGCVELVYLKVPRETKQEHENYLQAAPTLS